MQNIEFKAELRDLPLARTICLGLGATPILTTRQVDTYYRVPSGRLKKRESPSEPVEFIFYQRADDARPRPSTFTIYSEAAAVERFGVSPLPVWVVVEKKRRLLMLDNVRIHLDTVDRLGEFLEFEALVSRSQPPDRCRESIQRLRQTLSPALGEPIPVSYADLVAALDESEPESAG